MLFDLLSIFLTLSLFLIYHVYFWTRILDREDDVKQHLIIGSCRIRMKSRSLKPPKVDAARCLTTLRLRSSNVHF